MALPIVLKNTLSDFMDVYGSSDELYNEISLQLELGLYLRDALKGSGFKVQYERNIESFNPRLHKSGFVKKEIDIVIFDGDKPGISKERYAIELKFLKKENGKIPEGIYACVTDMQFMEEVKKHADFQETYCITLVDDSILRGSSSGGIYEYFRKPGTPISRIQKPTGDHKGDPAYDRKVSSSPFISWQTPKAGGDRRYYILKF